MIPRSMPLWLIAAAVLAAAAGTDVAAQERITRAQLVGSWSYVSNVNIQADGRKSYPQGEREGTGMLVFDASGHFSWQLIRSDIPKFAGNNRQAGSDEENRAVVRGSIAYFGDYSFDEANQTLTMRVTASTFSNWNGTEQKRRLELKNGELVVINSSGASGGTAIVTWKRLQ